ncbi:hypothetical protein L2E82_31847 [Cichorium intybus]|uniref:Uncharacterized protein n=1 Tax=Cichorium intybus TaxID=13427 RepID=A0ACB9BGD7_CICIN|nr:hypothetical protein L2E82_31847 [Cichorium intybus]
MHFRHFVTQIHHRFKSIHRYLNSLNDLSWTFVLGLMLIEVAIGDKHEYVRKVIKVVKGCGGLSGGKNVGDKQFFWMNHGDEAVKLPDGFEVVARSKQGVVAVVENPNKRIHKSQP